VIQPVLLAFGDNGVAHVLLNVSLWAEYQPLS
jgi:hypothetical protein